jgi:hypothetical protein
MRRGLRAGGFTLRGALMAPIAPAAVSAQTPGLLGAVILAVPSALIGGSFPKGERE